MTLFIMIMVVPFATLTLCFATEVFVGLRPLRETKLVSAHHLSVVIIVPAHDEESIIQSTLRNLKHAAAGRAAILLVADNCSDRTAHIGRAIGVDVIERCDLHRKGKGFALDFARNHLRGNPPAMVIIIDADCTISSYSIERLIASCAAFGRPCQARYLQRPSADASPSVQLSTFAFFIKNVIRQRGLQRLSGRVHLVGTGMAFPWTTFASAELATSNIVEDLKLGQDLAEAGHCPAFVERAAVWGSAETDANTVSQRRRWEGGFLQNAVKRGPQITAKALRSGDARLFWSGINTMVPPFALLILVDLVVASAALMLTWLFSAQIWPLLGLCGALLVALSALACAWACGGSRFVSLRNLGRAPLYVAWKLPMYVGFASRGAPKEWVRTGR